jgi:uncharacterized protein YkwD
MLSAKVRLTAIGPTVPQEFSIAAKEISIGSAAGNDLVIGAPGVSRRHAKIEYRRGGYRVIDLESTNGTYVNRERVRGASTFKIGDELRFGGASYRFNRASALAPKKSSILTMRRFLIFIVLFAIAFGVAEFQIIWNQFDESLASRTAAVAPAAGPPSAAMLVRSPLAARTAAASTAPTKSSAASATNAAVPAAPAVVATAVALAPPAVIASRVAAPQARSAAPSTTATAASPSLRDEAGTAAPWIETLNRHRALAGLGPVALDPGLVQAAQAHAHYVVANYSAAIKAGRLGAEAHTEDPAKPYYSAAGLAAARASTVEEEFRPRGGLPAPSEAIEGWLTVPFHRLWILNPGLRRAAFAQYCEARVCVSVLDVQSGADRPPSVAIPLQRPVMYPPSGSIVANGKSEGEWPSPVTACPGYSEPSGLPVSLQLGGHLDARLTDYSITRADGSAVPVPACGFDADSYVNPDPAEQERVRHVLIDFGAAIVVPRAPLIPGIYDVSITAGGRPFSWSFTIAP